MQMSFSVARDSVLVRAVMFSLLPTRLLQDDCSRCQVVSLGLESYKNRVRHML